MRTKILFNSEKVRTFTLMQDKKSMYVIFRFFSHLCFWSFYTIMLLDNMRVYPTYKLIAHHNKVLTRSHAISDPKYHKSDLCSRDGILLHRLSERFSPLGIIEVKLRAPLISSVLFSRDVCGVSGSP